MNFYYDTEYNFILNECDFYPDFQITSNANNLKVSSGQSLTIPVTLNFEGITSNSETDIEFWLSSDDENLGFRILEQKISFEPSQSTISSDFVLDIPLTFGTGRYFLTIIVDSNSEVLERDELNNYVNIIVNIDNSSLDDQLLFPNPVNDLVKVFVRDKAATGKVEILISDFMGRIFLEGNSFKDEEEFFTSFDVSSFPEGIYAVKFSFKFGKDKTFVFYKTSF
jgi:hypothetical protein